MFSFVFSVFLLTAASSLILTQTPNSVTVPENNSVSISCKGEAQNDQKAVFWYRQTNGTTDFQFLMHTSTIGRETHAKGIEQRFKTTLRSGPELCILKISMLKKEDSGMYYCTVLHGGIYTAASGTNLTVGGEHKQVVDQSGGRGSWNIRSVYRQTEPH